MDELKKIDTDEIKKVSPILQLFFIFLSSFIIYLLILNRLNNFRAHDLAPNITLITPKKYNDLGGFSSVIKTGLFIDQFEEFDMINNSFVFTGIIWFEFNPGTISLSTLEKFSFERSRILDRSPPEVKVVDSKLLVSYNIRVKFSTSLNNKEFPVEDHTVYITLVHKYVQPKEILFDSQEQDFVIKSDVSDAGWKIVNKKVVTGYKEDQINEFDKEKTLIYPTTIFSMDYSRVAIRFVMSILLPLLMIFYLILFALSLETKPAMPLTTGGITATIAYRFVIDKLSPSAGYFMISDLLFFLILGMSCLTFFVILIEAYIVPFTLAQKKIVLFSLHMIINTFCFYLFYV